jgi:hypothetical protein
MICRSERHLAIDAETNLPQRLSSHARLAHRSWSAGVCIGVLDKTQIAFCGRWAKSGRLTAFSLVTSRTVVAAQTFFEHSSHSASDEALYSQTAKSLSVLLIAAIPKPWFGK